MRNKHLTSFLAILVTVNFLNSQVFAVGSGGYENQVPGARAMGRANSVVASIDDASAVSFNPARLTAIQASQFSIGVTAQNLTTKFDDGAGTTQTSDNDMAFTPNISAASKFGLDKWAFGLGINVPHGVATKWERNTPMALVATDTDLAVLDVNPAAAYKVNDQVSVGAGIDYYKARVKSNNQPDVSGVVNVGPDGISDLDTSVHGDGDDFGANVGISYAPSEKNMFGLSYRTGAKVDVDGDFDVTALTTDGQTFLAGGNTYTTTAKAEIVVPGEVQLGYARKISDKFILEFDGQWTDWSEFKEQKVEFGDGTSSTVAKDWQDVWSVGLGGEFMLKENVALRAGYAFFDSPVPNSTFEASTPDADLHELSLGAGFGFGNVTLDFAGQFYFLNDRHINNSATLSGTYETHAEYYAMNVGYKFGGAH